MASQPALARRLHTADAVHIGIGSMVGAGLFAVFAPAARAAGAWLLLGLAVAAVVALANATSSAQLAAQYPTSGGTYVYGRERLGEWWGFLAGWGFVIGKTASVAAMAMTFAAYVAPHAWQKPVAVAAVLALAAVNYHGVTRTARLTRIIVTIVLAGLALVLTVILARGGGTGWTTPPVGGPSVTGILQSAALLFFAFAGYARIATMGEEVIDPRRTIPRAVLIAFTVVVPLYAVTALTLLGALGPDDLARSSAPLHDAAAAVDAPVWVDGLIVGAAVAATLGALLALIAGVGRTALAMARNRDLPGPLAAVHQRYAVPHVAEVVLAAVVCGLIVVADLREAVGFSSFGVLTYYAVANAAALTQDPAHRRFPRWVQVVGLIGCVVLALAVPTESLVPGLAVLAVGLAGRALVGLRRSRRGGDG